MENVKTIMTNTVSISELAKNVSKYCTNLKEGPKVVIKNNKPEAVIMSPEEYVEMIDIIQDLQDSILALGRLDYDKDKLISKESALKKLGISEEELEDIEVEFEWNGLMNIQLKHLKI